MSERQGIEIDYCPECRGIWLDRGELDKIIERSMQFSESQNTESKHDKKDYDHEYKHEYKNQHAYKHRKKSFFEELFD
jgi:Zn-finger nucleic acid-binding protein